MIDVIIPAYNCSKTLGRTLDSLVAQTDTDFKVTVVDDCSTEDIKTIVDEYSTKLQISYIRNENNVGCGMTRQAGINNTTCSHFTFLDSDDMFMPYTVETFNRIIQAEPTIGLIHSYIYEQAIVNGERAIRLHKDGFSYCHGKLYNRELVQKFEIKNSPSVRWHDDSYFNSMCSELMEMKIVPIPMLFWCYNSNSITRKVDRYRDEKVVEDFLLAMNMSKEHVLKYKETVDHIPHTVQAVMQCKDERLLTDRERELLTRLKEVD